MTFEVSEIVTPDLVTETVVDPPSISARLVGSAEAVHEHDLTSYLEAIQRAVVAIGAAEVVLDVRSLEFMSAACLRSLVVWIGETQRASQCRMRVVWDPVCAWQRRSLRNIVSTLGEPVPMD